MEARDHNARRREDRELRTMVWELERQSWGDYLAAGAPFGFTREALSVWMEHAMMTTAN